MALIRPNARRGGTAAIALASAMMLAGSTVSFAQEATEFSVLITAENGLGATMLEDLAANACKAENDALPLRLDRIPSAQMQQQILLLAGQDALPVWFAAGQQFIYGDGQLAAAGQVLDMKATLTELGVFDKVTPAAQSVVDQLYAGEFPTLPVQFNTEGIFYNKTIFADNGIAVPTTFEELLAAARTLKEKGITPIVAAGKTGYTISRWIGQLLYRKLGPNAMAAVRDGTAKLTDPDYVAAAQTLQDMGAEGLFIDGITNIDNPTALNQLFTGEAAMMYNLTSILGQVNDPAVNTQDLGFFPFPAMEGGAGSADQIPANVGSPNVFSAKLYGPKVGAWLTCIANNYASVALAKTGTFSGLALGEPVADTPALTTEIKAIIDNSASTVLWFEALFNQKATTDASNNAAPLLTGGMSAEDYMATLQADLEQF